MNLNNLNLSNITPEISDETQKLSAVETIKVESNYLRGTIQEGLQDRITGAISEDDTQLIKFHGSYQQTDRDLEQERRKQKLEPLYSFMIRVRLAGGITTPAQWLAMDTIADTWGNNTLKLTTRQAYQVHSIYKKDLKKTIQAINNAHMDTIAACGDVNRNVMCNPNPYQSKIHEEVLEATRKIHWHLTPQTSAYKEIWLDEKPSKEDNEPIYGKTYLPRKFKIAVAIPPNNDTDIYANDIGLIAIEDNGKLLGFNVAAGGGLGTSAFGLDFTYPRLATVLGFVPTDKIIDVVEKIVLVQKTFGNRSDRRQARLKYTIDRMGIPAFKAEVERRLGFPFEAEKKFAFLNNGDEYGWQKGTDGKWHATLFIEGGRVKDTEEYKLKTGLREIAKIHKGDFRLTGNQNLIIGAVNENDKPKIQSLLDEYGIWGELKNTVLRKNSMACVALNTCTLAHAEAERYLPSLIDKLDPIMEKYGLSEEPIIIRMTGCPNGCGRPYLGEIGFVGRAPGKYNLYLGAGFAGDRLNNLYKEMLSEKEILEELEPIIADYSKNRNKGERFGNFVIRKQYVAEIKEGKEFSH